jgi:hypothetical protein
MKNWIVLRQDDPRWNLDRGNDFEQLFGSIDTDLPIEYVTLESIPNPQQLPAPQYHIFVQGKEEWNQLQQRYFVTPVHKEGFQHIRIMEIRAPGAAISVDAVTVLNMTKPIFRFVRGGMTIEAHIEGNPITLASASPRDTQGLIFQDRWFASDAAEEIIIGINDLKSLPEHIRDHTNSPVEVVITRRNRFGAVEILELPLRIVNFAPNSMIPSGLANNLHLWQKGEVTFSTSGQFLREHEVEAATGTRRAKLFLRSPEVY